MQEKEGADYVSDSRQSGGQTQVLYFNVAVHEWGSGRHVATNYLSLLRFEIACTKFLCNFLETCDHLLGS